MSLFANEFYGPVKHKLCNCLVGAYILQPRDKSALYRDKNLRHQHVGHS